MGFLSLSAIAFRGNSLTTLAQDGSGMENQPDPNKVMRESLKVRITALGIIEELSCYFRIMAVSHYMRRGV